MRIVGILLAGGRGTRFGGDKLLAPLPAPAAGVPAGTPVGIASATHFAQALAEVVAVLRPGDLDLAAGMLAAGAARPSSARTPTMAWARRSPAACRRRATPTAGSWRLPTCRGSGPSTIASVAAALAAGADIVAPAYRGKRGHPVGFARRHRDALIALGRRRGCARAGRGEPRDRSRWSTSTIRACCATSMCRAISRSALP